MADFPGKVNTQTSSPAPQSSFTLPFNVDVDFIKSIPGILLIAEIFFGMVTWALIASVPYYTAVPAYGWVMFVSVTFWILSIVLFVIIIMGLDQNLPSIPWPLVILVFYAVATILYITAFLADAFSVPPRWYSAHTNLGASAFFAIVVTLLYAASSFFAYLGWRGEGQNAAGTTVPV